MKEIMANKIHFTLPYNLMELVGMEPLNYEVGSELKINNFHYKIVENDMQNIRFIIERIMEEK